MIFQQTAMFLLGALVAAPAAVLGSFSQPSDDNCTYPSATYVTNLLDTALDSTTELLGNFADDVDWIISGTHPLAGHYHNKTVFYDNSLARLEKTFDTTQPISINVTTAMGGCDDPWVVAEFVLEATCLNGLAFTNPIIWVAKFNAVNESSGNPLITEGRAYFDSFKIWQVITENEAPNHTGTEDRTLILPGPDSDDPNDY